MFRYLRHAVGWRGLFVATAAMAGLFALAIAVPAHLGGLVLACLVVLAVAVALLFDEQAIAVVRVAPRSAAWRFGARAVAVVIPAAGWGIGVWVLSARLDGLNRGGWWLIGVGVALAVCGAATSLVRRGSATPGAAVAAAAVLVVAAPLVPLPVHLPVTVYPFGTFPDTTIRVWTVIVCVSFASVLRAARSTPHR
jgi:hypothetical protein